MKEDCWYVQLLQLSGSDTGSRIDDIMPDRAEYGLTKTATSVSADDVKLLIQSMYVRDCIGPWHQSLAQFVEGNYTKYTNDM